MDFTNYCPVDYCPVDSLGSEDETKVPMEKSHRNHITWFSRRVKGASSHNKRLGQESGDLFREHLCSYNGSGDVAYHHHFPDSHRRNVVESVSDEDYHPTKHNTRSLEMASRYVSQEELNALKGCVMRRRAVFSPSPSSSPVHSFVHKQPSSPTVTNSLPTRRRASLRTDEASHVRQSSLEYDHLKDFNPSMVVNSNTTDSVSVQFRLQGCAEKEELVSNGACSIHHNSLSIWRHDTDCSSHIGSDLYRSCHQNFCSCDLQSLQETERCRSDASNSWPRNELSAQGITKEPITEKIIPNAFSSLIGRSNHVQLHYSPFHSKYSSPVLSKHKVYSFEGSLNCMKACDTGSNYSLYSQTTTASSLTDRQHCSYSKGVDGNLFKDRTEVCNMIVEVAPVYYVHYFVECTDMVF